MVEAWIEYNNVTQEEILRKESVCLLPLASNEKVIDVYVFNKMVLARLSTSRKFVWFMKPLSSDSYARRLTFDEEKSFADEKLRAGVFVGNTTSDFVHFYGVKGRYINIYTF